MDIWTLSGSWTTRTMRYGTRLPNPSNTTPAPAPVSRRFRKERNPMYYRENQKRHWLATSGALFALLLMGTTGAICPAMADENLVWVTGRVFDTDRRPLANAMIAVYDDKNKVVDYTK